ncbi:hypothetical protein LCGC14_0195190 [marine sediment metagenome]|uniref:Uncharacterized protein n=1 Tax=marine sediment metagenome TaxID=412755 RepID=A0A0F9X4B1_9ZZZZ
MGLKLNWDCLIGAILSMNKSRGQPNCNISMDKDIPIPTKSEDMSIREEIVIRLQLKYTQSTSKKKDHLLMQLQSAINGVLVEDLYKIVETWQID